MIITSPTNEKIKELGKLIKTAKERKKQGLYIVEGIRMFKEIPKEDMYQIFVAESSYQTFEDVIGIYNVEPYIIPDKLFRELSDTDTPQGIMAVVRMKENSLDDILSIEDNPCLFIIEKLQDPGNLGTIIRTSEGAGVTGIILSNDSVDIYNPKVVRSTMGAIFRVPVYVSSNLKEDIEIIKQHKISVYGAHLDGRNLYEDSFVEGCAFLIGNEGNGLSDEISATADKLIRIPMKGKLESLNAATSATVIGYEVLRQRM